MQTAVLTRRSDILADTLRKFLRRNARSHISKMLRKVRPEDVAVALRNLAAEERLDVFRILTADYPDVVGDVLVELEESQVADLIAALDPNEVVPMLEGIPVDDAVWVVETLPESVRSQVLDVVDMEQLAEVQAHLTYDEDTAGRVMDTEFLAIEQSTPVQDAIERVQADRDRENVFYLYVVDADGRLVGVTSLRQLLLSPPQSTLGDVAKRKVIQADVDTDQEEVAKQAARYDFLAIPITDHDNHLVGIVTIDDIIDIFKEEATEDFYRLAGSSENELLYQDRPLKIAGIRGPWLLFNLVGSIVSGMLLYHFQVGFREALFLMTFVPVVMAMGGNIGSQTSTITVRGLGTGRVELGRVRQFLWQQTKAAMLIALASAILVAIAAVFMNENPWYAAVVGLALLAAMMLASLSGVLIPVLFERFDIDPALASGPLVTTANDITGILIYFGCAALFIGLLIR